MAITFFASRCARTLRHSSTASAASISTRQRTVGKQRDYWMRYTMGDPRQRYPEILGRLEQVLSVEPSLDHDISWLFGVPATLWFTRRRRDV